MRYTRYMAKKSSKSTRRNRAKQDAAKKKPSTKVTKTAAVIAEGSDEPVVKAEKKAPAKKTTAKKSTAKTAPVEKPIEAAVEAEMAKNESVEDMLQPTRNRMLVSAVALGVIVIALIFGATIVHQQQNASKSDEMVKSGMSSGKADQILQSGGNVCTNGNSQTDTTGSSNPQSVGMMLQSNPVSTIQTPETVSNGSDVSTLQGASCF